MPWTAIAQTEEHLTILHDNDIHGKILPFLFKQPNASEEQIVGGAARRATLARSLRAKDPEHTLLIDAGDISNRGPLATTYEGIAETDIMNAMGYDLAAIGNNEVRIKEEADSGDIRGSQEDLLRIIRRSRFPWICANVLDVHGSLLPGVEPFVVRKVGNLRVAFLGLTTPASAVQPQTKGWTFGEPIAAAREWVPKALAEADVVIAVTHLGVGAHGADQELAAKVKGIAAIVSGNSHTYLYKAIEVTNPDGWTVPIVQAGDQGVNLGKFDLSFTRGKDSQWRLSHYEERLIPVTAELAEAPDVARVVDSYVKPLRMKVGDIADIGVTPAQRRKITASLFAKAFQDKTGADAGLCPHRGDRWPVTDTFTDRAVTKYDVLDVLPLHQHVVLVNISGTALLKLVHPERNETGISAPVDPFKTDSMYQVAAQERNQMEISIPVAEIRADRMYRVAMVDAFASQGLKFKPEEIHDTGIGTREAFIAWLKSQSHKR